MSKIFRASWKSKQAISRIWAEMTRQRGRDLGFVSCAIFTIGLVLFSVRDANAEKTTVSVECARGKKGATFVVDADWKRELEAAAKRIADRLNSEKKQFNAWSFQANKSDAAYLLRVRVVPGTTRITLRLTLEYRINTDLDDKCDVPMEFERKLKVSNGEESAEGNVRVPAFQVDDPELMRHLPPIFTEHVLLDRSWRDDLFQSLAEYVPLATFSDAKMLEELIERDDKPLEATIELPMLKNQFESFMNKTFRLSTYRSLEPAKLFGDSMFCRVAKEEEASASRYIIGEPTKIQRRDRDCEDIVYVAPNSSDLSTAWEALCKCLAGSVFLERTSRKLYGYR